MPLFLAFTAFRYLLRLRFDISGIERGGMASGILKKRRWSIVFQHLTIPSRKIRLTRVKRVHVFNHAIPNNPFNPRHLRSK
jgi:hypothetical protein